MPRQTVNEVIMRLRADKQAAVNTVQVFKAVETEYKALVKASEQVAKSEKAHAEQTERLQQMLDASRQRRADARKADVQASQTTQAAAAQEQKTVQATTAAVDAQAKTYERAQFKKKAALEQAIAANMGELEITRTIYNTQRAVDQDFARQQVAKIDLLKQERAQLLQIQAEWGKVGSAQRKGTQFSSAQVLLGRGGFTDQGYANTYALSRAASIIDPRLSSIGYEGRALAQTAVTLGTLTKVATQTGPATTRLVGAVSKLGVASPETAVAVGTLAVAAVALYEGAKLVSPVIKAWGDQNKQAAQLTQGSITALKEYYDFIGSATTEQIIERQKQAADDVKATRQYYGDLVQLRDAIEQGIDLTSIKDFNAVDLIAEVGLRGYDLAGGSIAGLDELKKAIDAAGQEATTNEILFNKLTEALVNNAGAANDDALRQDKYAARRVQAIKAQADAQIEADQRVRDWTSEQANERIADLQSEQAALQATVAELEAMASTSEDAAAQLTITRDRLSEIPGEIEEIYNSLLPLIQIREQIDDTVQSYKDAQSLSSEAAQDRLAEIEVERAAIRQAYEDVAERAANGEDVSAIVKELDARYTALGKEQQNLVNNIIPEIQAREAEADVIEHLKEAEDQLADAREQHADIAGQLAQAEAEYADDIAATLFERQRDDLRTAQDQAREDAQAQAKLNADLIALDRKGYQDRAKLIEKQQETADDAQKALLKEQADYNKQAARDAIDHWRKMRDIESDARRSIAEAALRLDATAVREARVQRAEKLKDENEQYALEQQRRKEDYDERIAELNEQSAEKRAAAQQDLRDLEQSLAEQRNEKIAAFNEQQQIDAQSRAIARQRLLEDRAYEDAVRAAAHQKELNALYALDAAATQLANSAQSAISRLSNASGTYYHQATAQEQLEIYREGIKDPYSGPLRLLPLPGSGNGYMTLRAYGDGGELKAGQMGVAGERGVPELIWAKQDLMITPLNQLSTRSMGNAYFYITGDNPQEIARQVDGIMQQYLGVA